MSAPLALREARRLCLRDPENGEDCSWYHGIWQYLRLLEGGVPFLAIRYNELDADREGVAARLLRHAGLPASAGAAAVGAFASDSQAGTRIGRSPSRRRPPRRSGRRWRGTRGSPRPT